MMKQYDVIIVGAGNAGLACARTAAIGGLNVLVIDKRRHGNPGHDWCDVVEKDIFQRIGLDMPPPALWRPVTLPTFTTPDMADRLGLEAGDDPACPHLYIDRKKMNQWLVGLIEPLGNIDIRKGINAVGPHMEGSRVAGVRTVSRKTNAQDVVKSDFVVDASGLQAVIGSQTPYSYPFRADHITPRDAYTGIKEILPVDDADIIRRVGNRILMGYGGGMAWTMIYWENMIDVGVAIPQNKGPKRIKKLLYELKLKLGLSLFTPARRGAGLLPVRRCRTRLVGEGYLIVGDAACQINPSNGGGISPALLAGHLAGETLLQACRGGHNDVGALWPYPVRYITRQGAAYAGLDVMRACFQSLSENEILLLFRKGLIHIDDLAVPFIKGQRPAFNMANRLSGAVRCISRPDLLVKLSRALYRAQAIESAYRNIPPTYDMKHVDRWEEKIFRRSV